MNNGRGDKFKEVFFMGRLCNRKWIIALLVIVVVLLVLNLNNNGWDKAEPSEVGIDSIKIEELSKVIENRYNHIQSVTIVKDNKLVFQEYKDGYDKDSLFVLNSATKTITSTLIGIALKEGYINNIDEAFISYFPQYHN